EAARRMEHGRVGGTFGPRTGLTKAGNRAVHEPRMVWCEDLVIESQTTHYAGAKILDDDVAPGGKLANQVEPCRMAEIDRHASLPAIEAREIGALAITKRRLKADKVALGRFDLDNLRAEIGQHPGAVRSRDDGREIENPHATENFFSHSRSAQ